MQRVFLVLMAVLTVGVLVGLPAWMTHTFGGAPTDGVVFEQGPEAGRAYEAALAADREAKQRAKPAAPARPEVADAAPRTTRASAPGPAKGVVYVILGPEGEPLAGMKAVLSVLPGTLEGRSYWPAQATVPGDAFLPSGELRLEATSDEAGEVRFPDAPRDRRIRVDIAPQSGWASACWIDSTQYIRRQRIRLRRAAGALDVRVEGLPPHQGTPCLMLLASWHMRLGSGPITTHATFCVEPLDDGGRCMTPTLPGGPLHADVYVPGVGLWRNIAVERLAEGSARVVIPAVETMTLKGQLLDPHGNGVGGASLALAVRPFLNKAPPHRWLRYAQSDDDGRFVFSHVPAGVSEELHIEIPGCAAPRLVLEDAPLLPGETLDIPVQVVPECTAHGRVFDEEGRPVAGARIRASSRWTSMVLWDAGPTWTDAQGRWFLDRLPPGPCTITARAHGFASEAEVKFDIERGAPAEAPHAWLAKSANSGRVRARVVGPGGTPVLGATVLYRLRNKNMSGQGDSGITDADGRHTLTGIQAELDSFEIWAHKNGAVSRAYPIEIAEIAARTAEVRVELPPVGQVRGVVRIDGKPGVGLTVLAVDTRVQARTDHEGAFHLRGLPPGMHGLRVRLASGANAGAPHGVEVLQDKTTDVEIDLAVTLEMEHAVSGRLLDHDGAPLAGVRLVADASGRSGMRGRGTTDDEGRFRIPVAQRGTFDIRSGRILAAGASTEEPTEIRFDPARLPLVQGRVVTHDGKPCAGGEVQVSQHGSGREPNAHAGGGWFRMELRPSQREALSVSINAMCIDAWGRSLPDDEPGVAFKPGDTVEVPASRPKQKPAAGPMPPRHGGRLAGLVGLVVGSDGEPVEDAVLYKVKGRGRTSIGRTGPDGRFASPAAPAKPFELEVEAPRGYRSTTSARTVRGSAGPLRIVLPALKASEMFTATLHVKDLDGQPIEGMQLMIGHWMGITSRPSDAAGRIVVERLVRREYVVATRPWQDDKLEGYEGRPEIRRRGEIVVSPEQPDVTVTLPVRKLDPSAQHDVWIKFTDAAGAILEGSHPSVSLQGLGDREDVRYEPQRRMFGRKEAQVRIPAVREARYRVVVSFPGYDPAYLPVKPFEIEVPHAPIEIPLRRAAQVHGRIVHDDIASCRVRFVVVDGDTRTWITRTPSTSGHFTFNIDPRLRATLVAYHLTDEYYGLLEDVPASETPVEMKLETKGIAVRGRVTGLKRVPKDYRIGVEGVLLGGTAALAKDGTFALTGLPPGTYDITFETEDLDALVRRPKHSRWIHVAAKAEAGGPVIELDPLEDD